MNTTNTPPTLQSAKSSTNGLLVWAITATAASVFLAILSLVLLLQIVVKPLPVSVAFRPALNPNNGLVAQIHNNSSEELKVLLSLSSPDTGKKTEVEIIIGPDQIKEFGWIEGWAFVAGETIKIHNGKYRDLVFIVPSIPNK